jgi:hypothetical protein
VNFLFGGHLLSYHFLGNSGTLLDYFSLNLIRFSLTVLFNQSIVHHFLIGIVNLILFFILLFQLLSFDNYCFHFFFFFSEMVVLHAL